MTQLTRIGTGILLTVSTAAALAACGPDAQVKANTATSSNTTPSPAASLTDSTTPSPADGVVPAGTPTGLSAHPTATMGGSSGQPVTPAGTILATTATPARTSAAPVNAPATKKVIANGDACTDAQLTGKPNNPYGRTGNYDYPIVVTNSGPNSCALPSYIDLKAYDSNGAQRSLNIRHLGTPGPIVTLEPQQQASFDSEYTSRPANDQTVCTHAASLRAFLANDAKGFDIPTSNAFFAPCDTRLDIFPVQAGTGAGQ